MAALGIVSVTRYVGPPNGVQDVLRLLTDKDRAIEWDSRQKAYLTWDDEGSLPAPD